MKIRPLFTITGCMHLMVKIVSNLRYKEIVLKVLTMVMYRDILIISK